MSATTQTRLEELLEQGAILWAAKTPEGFVADVAWLESDESVCSGPCETLMAALLELAGELATENDKK